MRGQYDHLTMPRKLMTPVRRGALLMAERKQFHTIERDRTGVLF